MTDDELEEVRRRLAAWRTCENLDDKRALAAALAGDVPALLAEVERLRRLAAWIDGWMTGEMSASAAGARRAEMERQWRELREQFP